MITKNKFQKLLEKVNFSENEITINEFKNYCLINDYPSRYYENLIKNFKIVSNNYSLNHNILYKKCVYMDYADKWTTFGIRMHDPDIENLGIIGVIQDKCKPYLVFAFKSKLSTFTNKGFEIVDRYTFSFEDPKHIKILINGNKLQFKGD